MRSASSSVADLIDPLFELPHRVAVPVAARDRFLFMPHQLILAIQQAIVDFTQPILRPVPKRMQHLAGVSDADTAHEAVEPPAHFLGVSLNSGPLILAGSSGITASGIGTRRSED